MTTARGALLIDTPPELREACIQYGVNKVDAVALTHAHMDHVAAFDDLRRFNTINGGVPLKCYCSSETEAQMHRIFPYISEKSGENGLFRPQIVFDNTEIFETAGLRLRRLEVEHGFPCNGYLIEELGKSARLGYISDCHEIPEGTIDALHGVEVMVLNCLREREHPTHLSLVRALAYLERIKPGRAYLTHMCHDLSHVEWERRLQDTFATPAYDGLTLSL